MSYVAGSKSVDPKTHFEAGIKDFARIDKVRVINISGLIQYGIIYSIIYFIIGIAIQVIFPPFEKGVPLFTLFFWILLQCLVIIIVTFYAQKFVEAIPGWASLFPNYFNFNDLLTKGFIPYGIDEFKGSMAANIVLIGTQINLLNKVAYFTQEITKKYTF
jgi:hypothetical protein